MSDPEPLTDSQLVARAEAAVRAKTTARVAEEAYMDRSKASWSEILRSMGVKLAHPDDGWVDRVRCVFTLSWYPQFNDAPEVGDLIAFGKGYPSTPHSVEQTSEGGEVYMGEGYRLCRVTEVDHHVSRYAGLSTSRYSYEDTGVRVPPLKPEPVPWLKRMASRWSR